MVEVSGFYRRLTGIWLAWIWISRLDLTKDNTQAYEWDGFRCINKVEYVNY